MGRQRGSVFLLTLVVTLVVAAVTMTMSQAVAARLRGNDSHQAQSQSRHAALGMLRATVNDLNVAYQSQQFLSLLTLMPDGEYIGACSGFLIGRDPLGREPRFALIPEAALIDVNNARHAVLAALPGMDESIAAAIIDWRDEDEETHEAGGAERGDGHYQGAVQPYEPRNAPFESLEELRLVRGVSDALWFGEDQNWNGVLDFGEDTNRDGQLNYGLRDLLCLESREPATQSSGEDRVPLMPFNQNIAALLIEKLGEERGAELYQAGLTAQPFTSRLHFLSAIEIEDDEAALLWSAIIGPEGRVGLLDAWSAPVPVLEAVCGEALAAKILGARPLQEAASLKWLADSLTEEEVMTVGPFLSCGSYQFRADILALRNDAAAWDRMHAFIDVSTGTARVLRIQAAQTLPWPFPATSLHQLRTATGHDPIAQINGSQSW